MKKILGLMFVVSLIVVPAMAQKVTIDFAHDFDFEQIKTFQYVDTAESNSKNELMAERIKDFIISDLQEGGLTQVEENPDMFVTYHITTKENTNYNTSTFGYGGYRGGWGGWGYGGGGMATSTTRAYTYTEGTLIIDAYESTEKKMIWRGTGTVTVKNTPEKQTKQITKILHKLGKKWDKILKNKGK